MPKKGGCGRTPAGAFRVSTAAAGATGHRPSGHRPAAPPIHSHSRFDADMARRRNALRAPGPARGSGPAAGAQPVHQREG